MGRLSYPWCIFLVLWLNTFLPLTLAYSNSPSSTNNNFHSHALTRPSTTLVQSWGLERRRRRRGPDQTLLPLTTLNMSPNKDSSDDEPQEGINPITKASWYAVEWFGKTFAPSRNSLTETTTTGATPLNYDGTKGPPQSLEETLQRIQHDNDRSYFLSGQVDEAIYDINCVFRDPFVSFAGRERFVTNLANLGSFISKYQARVLEYNQPNDTTIQTKIMVKLELNLPWKPILAWPWGVTYTIDPSTYCIIDHEESWDIEPWEGVKQIFRKPTLKL